MRRNMELSVELKVSLETFGCQVLIMNKIV